MRRNPFGQPIWVKKLLIRAFGLFSYPRFNWQYKQHVEGSEILADLPNENVLLVSNHQTYFADVIFMFHVIQSSLKGRPNNIRFPGFLFAPKHNIFFVAAEETMKSGLLPRIMRAGGAITVKRTWRKDGKDTKRDVDMRDPEKIVKALNYGWVISFPQGTTKPFVPGRKGTAHYIKQTQPVVVPVVIDGFRRAFDKKGLRTKKTGTDLQLRVKQPLSIDYQSDLNSIMKQIMDGIEQSEEFLQVK